MNVVAEIPKKLGFLFEPWQYKVAYGGRHGIKSWSFARALLIQCVEKPLRILCAREYQKSIKQSVHTLLSDQIQLMQLGQYFEVLDAEIRSANGTQFTFAGLHEHTVESIKSFEGVDIVWVEEAQTVKKRSWDILIPTIRKPGSEIWVSFNPELDTDDTYVRFVVNPPPGCKVVKTSWRDAKKLGWWTDKDEQKRLHCQATDKENYPNIWEGKCRAAVIGAIYAGEIATAIENGHITNVGYDPRLKVHVICDLGWNDYMSLGMVQVVRSEIRFIDYVEDNHKTLDWYSAELKQRRYNWGTLWLPPTDGNARDYRTGRSAKEIYAALGWDTQLVEKLPIETGIRAVRQAFSQMYFDKTKCAVLIDHMKRYRRHVQAATNDEKTPVHDEHSHGADMVRYTVVSADKMHNEDTKEINDADLLPTMGIGL